MHIPVVENGRGKRQKEKGIRERTEGWTKGMREI